MGEEKTTNHYIIATVSFLLILMFFPVFSSIYHGAQKENVSFAVSASTLIFKLEVKASMITNLMNSFALNPSIPLM